MTTAIFVTPLLDPESPVRGFATTHVQALAGRFDRVVVVAGSARGDLGDLGAQVVTPDASDQGRGALGIGPPLARVLADTEGPSLVMVDNDQACLLQARSLMRDRRRPLLWWCPRIPSSHAATEAARWADALLVAAAPSSPVVGCPVFSVGAGIDLGAATGASGFPERPPLRLIAVGRTSPRKGLPVIVRTVAIARSNGIDARLLIVGPSTNAAEWQHRRELECLVNDLALTDSVRVANALTPGCVGEMVRRAHVLVDAGCGNDLSRSALEAMAAGRIVISASAAVAPMLERASPIPLSFAAGNAPQLAERIAGLSAAWPSRGESIAAALRAEVEQGHSAEQWAERVAKAACASGASAP